MEDVPAVGDLYDIDYERLMEVRPTHVLVQPPARGLDPEFQRLAEKQGWRVGAWRLDTIEDVTRMVRGIVEILPDIDGLKSRAIEIEEGIAAALKPDAGVARCGRVLLVESVDPVLVFGKKTYLDEILTALGGENAVTLEGYPELTLEDVTRINPDAIILIREKPLPGRPEDHLGPIQATSTRAVREGRVAILGQADALMPSTAIPVVAQAMRDAAGTIESRR